jgi:hypothetical protein
MFQVPAPYFLSARTSLSDYVYLSGVRPSADGRQEEARGLHFLEHCKMDQSALWQAGMSDDERSSKPPACLARSYEEIIASLRREGWRDTPAAVFRSRDGKLAKVVWFDGITAEGPVESNQSHAGQ